MIAVEKHFSRSAVTCKLLLCNEQIAQLIDRQPGWWRSPRLVAYVELDMA